MLSLQNHPASVFALGSDLNRNDFPSDQDPQRRNSTRSMAEPPTSPECPAVDDNGSHSANGGTDSISNSSDGERRPYGLPTEWGVSIYHNPFSESTLVAASSPATFEYSTNTSPHNDYPAGGISPKIEELDDGEELHRIRPSDVENQNNATGLPANVPRKRGRPRKHPPPDTAPAKITKGRSKTGCITCRRRKKKCDETKPACLNCEKNSVQCEGYPPKEIWKSGKQKVKDAARTESIIFTPQLPPPMVDGIENETDLRLFDHFVYGFSRVLTLINDDSNPFKEILLPMASQHGGLMHSLLCLSGSHLSGLDPGPEINDRKNYHFHRAITDLKDSINSTSKRSETEPQLLIEDPIIASTIALSLNTICEGETRGEYRPHMDAARFLLVNQQPRNEKFRQFIVEFFQYHDVSNSLTSLDRRPAHLRGDLRLPDFIPHAQAGAFLGVFDGLFNYISEVTKIRDRIRHRFNEGHEPAVDFQALSDGVTIDSAIRSWEPSYEPNTPNWFLAQLYRQSTWVYLYRTMCPSRPSEKLTCVVDDGLSYLDQLPQDAGAYSIVLMPLFLMGCSAFTPRQRDRIKQGFQSLQSYSNLRNIRPAFTVVERVWEVMDSNIEESWDWEKIINRMGMDFLIT